MPGREEVAVDATRSDRGAALGHSGDDEPVSAPVRQPLPPAGQRSTRQRTALGQVLLEVDDFRSAQQLHAMLVQRGDAVGLTTVYRTIQALLDAGEVDVVLRADGEALYRRCSAAHHHHLVCRRCGRTVEVEGPAVERWAHQVADENGYTDVSHTVEVFGICASCATTGTETR